MKNQGTDASHSKCGGVHGKGRRQFWSIVFSATFLLFGNVAIGQTTTSTIEGIIRDANGAVVSGAQVKATSPTLSTERTVVTDSEGFYRIVSLPAGDYTLTVNQTGFATHTSKLELTLNRTVVADIQLSVGHVGGVVTVGSEPPLINTDTPATGSTVTPRQISDLPVNGRNYLDLIQLVPGAAINRHVNPDGDSANPVLGERSGNNNFFIDGHANKDTVDGGPAAPFNQDTIAEFQVLTNGYKAEFGQASGAIVNVVTKTGGNGFHGVGSFFLRNDGLDSSNSIDSDRSDPPYLRRYNTSFAIGGPVIKDKFFFFGSAERISEDRQIDFAYPPLGNSTLEGLIRNVESRFDTPTPQRETRLFLKLNQELGKHSLSQQFNYTNSNVYNYAPLSAGNSLPSTRTDRGSRSLLLAFGDTMLLGSSGDPWILTLRGAYRGEPSDIRPAHPETGGSTLLVPYALPVMSAFQIPGPLGTVGFGNNLTTTVLDQQYIPIAAIANKRFGSHDLKFGWSYLYTKVDGIDSRVRANQLFTTIPDFLAYSPEESGIRLLAETGGVTAADDEIHLRNHYNGLFVQDDWRIRKNLTVNLGIRWDKDSEFEANKNFAPRLGATWGITSKTVLRGQFGIFYDQFRLGIARSVPQLGGANQVSGQDMIFPRGLYGSPNFVSSVALLLLGSGPCFTNSWHGNLTDAQISSQGLTCTLAPSLPIIGVDRLNNVVASGRQPIPANAVITVQNIQALSGLTPEQYLTQINAAIGRPGFFTFGPTGYLTNRIIPGFGAPDVLENMDETPNTMGFSIGVQHEITKDLVFEADYHHKDIRNILGLRITNLAFRSRVVGRTFDPPGSQQLIGFGPYYEGKYDGIVLALNKRFSNRYQFGVSYAYSKATDNNRGITATPSDHYIGVVPLVTQGANSNANGSFTATNGNFVAQAGTFWNGPDVDKGNSDLALDHVFQFNGLVTLPWQLQVSGIFRAQSGFHFSRAWGGPGFLDPDGDGNTNGLDVRNAKRNDFTAAPFVNLDLRLGKRFDLTERVKLDLFIEYFNVFNRQNPASVDTNPASTTFGFGNASQVLPGREGQFGVRLAF